MLIEIIRESDDKLHREKWVFANTRDPYQFTLRRYINMKRPSRRFHYKIIDDGDWIPRPADVLEEVRQQIIGMINIR